MAWASDISGPARARLRPFAPRRISASAFRPWFRAGRPDLAGESLRSVKVADPLIVGERDEDVVQMNRRAYDQLTCEKSFEIVPGASHLFPEPGALDEVARLATGWFLKHLKKVP